MLDNFPRSAHGSWGPEVIFLYGGTLVLVILGVFNPQGFLDIGTPIFGQKGSYKITPVVK